MSALQATLWRRLILPERSRLISFALSLALGVGALFGVAHLLASVNQAMRRDAQQALGGDLRLSTWRDLATDPWYQEVTTRLRARGTLLESLEMASMATLDHQAPQLITLKGVSAGYPLVGQLEWITPPKETELSAAQAWVSQSLSTLRGAKLGDSISVAGRRFTIAGVIRKEPDAGLAGSLSFAPRVIVSGEALSGLGLISHGSRARRVAQWRRCERAPCPGGGAPIVGADALQAFTADLKVGAPEHIELRAHGDNQPQLLTIFERVALFFSMIGLVTLSLSTLSFISGLLGFLRDQLPMMGALRSLGVHPSALRRLYGRVTLWVGALGGGLGVGFGLILHYALSAVAAPWLGLEGELNLQPAHALLAVTLALWVSTLVNWVVQRALARASTHELWRAPDPQLKLTRLERAGLVIALGCTLGAYLYSLSGSVALSALFVLTLSLLTGVVALLIWLSFSALIWLRRGLRHRSSPAIRFAIGHLLGYRGRAWSALLSLSVGFSLIAALQGVQGSLERALELRDQAPPQLFMIDVQDDQVEPLRRLVSAHHATGYESLPLIRARIDMLKGERVSRASLDEGSVAGKMRARTLTREHNITTRVSPSSAEQVTLGRWWTEAEALSAASSYLSLEERFAGRLGVTVGDELTLDIQGLPVRFTVLNLRRVDWLSLRPNFLIVAPPGALEGAPRTHVASAHLSGDEALEQLSAESAQRLPNVSLIDTRPIFERGRQLLSTLSAALSLTGGLCALAGAMLLIGGVTRDRARRRQSVERLTSLGLDQAKAWRWVTLELSLLGGLSTLMISLSATALMWGATQALQLPLALDLTRLSLWLLLSATLAPLIGWLGPRGS